MRSGIRVDIADAGDLGGNSRANRHEVRIEVVRPVSDIIQGRRKRGRRGQKLGGANMSFCIPKNLEGALRKGRSGSHQFSLEV